MIGASDIFQILPQVNGHFTSISGHFFGRYIKIIWLEPQTYSKSYHKEMGIFDHFWPFPCQVHYNILQKESSNCHFDIKTSVEFFMPENVKVYIYLFFELFFNQSLLKKIAKKWGSFIIFWWIGDLNLKHFTSGCLNFPEISQVLFKYRTVSYILLRYQKMKYQD